MDLYHNVKVKMIRRLLRKLRDVRRAQGEEIPMGNHVSDNSIIDNSTPSRDLYELLWTGQGIEVQAGEKIDEPSFFSSRDQDFLVKGIKTLREHGYESANVYTNPTALHFQDMELRTLHLNGHEQAEVHELEFAVQAVEGYLRLGAEFQAVDTVSGRYNLHIFQKSHDGHRLAFSEKPSQMVLENTLGLMYRVLIETGYVSEKSPRLF